jgi:hypothetical protein
VIFGVLVRLGDHPGGTIRDALDGRSILFVAEIKAK